MRLKIVKRSVLAVVVWALFLSIGILSQKAIAQGMANVNVTGIPSVINTPYVDKFEQNFRNGRYQVIFTYNNSNTQPVDFRFQFNVTRNGKEIISVTSDPRSFQPGAYVFTSIFDELTFPQTFDQVINDIEQDIQNQIIQAGTAPEGNYVLSIEAMPQNGGGTINSAPSVNPFRVIYPNAPILLNPSDESNVSLETPVFNWTNVAVSGFTIEYNYLLVEVLENQTPLQGINSNRAIAEQTLMGQNTLVYTPEFLPLQPGQEYAWRVTAQTANQSLPIRNDGESPIHTFVYKKGSLASGIENIETIPLVPGYARLTNLDELDIDEQPNVYVLNGEATIELDDGQVHELTADVQGLTIQKGSPNNPNVMAGMVDVQGSLSTLPVLNAASNIVQFKRLRWTYSEGVQATGEILLPDESSTRANGWAQLTSQGLSGSLVADNPAGIIKIGEDPVELFIERFEASFPQMQLYAQGRVELFDGESICDLTQLNVLQDQSQAVFNCPDDASVSLVQNSAQLELLLNNLGGVIDYDFNTTDFSYDLDADGTVTLGVEGAGSCHVQLQVNLHDTNGFNISQITPVCSMYAPPINLGFVKLKLDAIDLKSLAYNSSNNNAGDWNFDLSLDGAISFPAMDGWTLPISTINVTNNGLQFPDLDWNAQQLGLNQPLSINGFQIEPNRFEMPKFTFPWFDWSQEDIDKNKTGDWNFTLNFDFNFPDFGNPGNGVKSDSTNILPNCIAARSIQGIDGSFDNGEFSAKIPTTVLRDCSIDLAEGYTFVINELGGEFMATASASDFSLNSDLSLDAGLEAGFPFNCDTTKATQAARTKLSMNQAGLLEGSIDDIVNSCTAQLGPFSASVTESKLIFDIESDRQQLSVDAGGELSLNSAQTVSGNMRYDILNGEFDELDFSYEDPFMLNLPSTDNSVLSFLVEGLSLTEDGILIDGRHEFILADQQKISQLLQQQTGKEIKLPEDMTTIGVTFDNTLISLSDFEIKSGRIIFDESFALLAQVNQQNTNIDFQVAEGKEELKLAPNSLFTALGGQIIIDKNGLHTQGKAEAGIKVGDIEFDDISVDFSKQFAMALKPFGVRRGQADLLHENRRIAYVNSTGFHLDPSYLTRAIPDTLPLPTKETAYIVLRDQNDSLRVDAQRQSDGTYTMSTINPIDLVIPAIQNNAPLPPSTKVSFTNITFDPGSGEVTAGSIQGNFNPAIDLNDMGVPLRLKSIRYDDGMAINGQNFSGERGIFLEGDLLLYEHQVGDNGSMALFLENGERLRGDVDLTGLDADIPLVPQSDFAVLNIDSLKGNVNVPLNELDFPDVSLNMGGQVRFQEGQQPLAALNYRANYDDKNFNITAINQPLEDSASGNNTAYIGSTGFRIDEIKTLTLSYRSATKDFDFRSELDFSILMNLEDNDTLQVPLKSVEITEQGFLIPDQTINSSSQPALNAPPVTLGPTELTVLEFRVLQDISFNWFTGEGIAPSFEMDLDMKLDAMSQNSPQASDASLTLNNVGFNQGIITGQLQDYPFQGEGAPVSLGGNTQFMLTEISGGLTNDGSVQNPVQGFNINLKGNLETPQLFATSESNCTNPTLDLSLGSAGGLVGSVANIAPCGDMTYGPATIAFDSTSSLNFYFSNDIQSIVLDGSVTAEIEQPENPNITATGDIEVDVIHGELINGSIQINDLFTYEYPQINPLFTFRVQQAQLDQSGLVFTGDAGLAFPNTDDTARVQFTNFNIEPQGGTIAGGSLTIQDSVAFEVGISPVNWKMVDPSSEFNRNNAGRLLTAAGITIDSNGLTLNGNSTAKIKAGGQSFPDVNLAYNNFQIGFAPTKVTAGQADFTLAGESSSFGYLDDEKFHLNLPGLITSVIPDTLGLPNKESAYLVLGDESGNRYELDENKTPRELRTMSGKTVELVIPKVTNDQNDTLKVQVAFDIAVDQFMNITSGSVTLENSVNLADYINIPLSLDSLNYDSSNQELLAAATVSLPSSLNEIELKTTAVIGNNGFEQASISAGDYSESYFPAQESVTPIAADSLGNGSLAFFVRGLELEIGQTNSLAFSGQIKSDLLQNNAGVRTPIHYAASYESDQWDVAIDNGNLAGGIDMGFAQLEPIPDGNQTFTVTMNQNEFAVAFAGIISMPELLGDGFSLEVQELKISTQPNQDGAYVTVNAQQNLPDQNFQLINGILDLTSTNTSVSITNKVLAIQTSGTFNFYDKQDLNFQDLKFSSDGNVDIGGVSASNLLENPIELISDSSLVLSDLTLGVENEALKMSANGFAKLPDPLDERANLTISANTDGNVDISGPNFVFDDDYSIDGGPTEFSIEQFATLEMTGLGLDINFSTPEQTSLYAAGVIFIENDVSKRIMFGDAGNLQQNPGIKYSPANGVEWNVSSNFDPNESPLSFDHEFFSISISSVQIETNITVDNQEVPFQAEIGGKTGLTLEGVGGSANFSGFKFSTLGVDHIGQIDGGGTFTLMDIVSLELGSFDYQTAPEGQTVSLVMPTSSGSADSGASVDSSNTVDVVKYLHFKPGPSGEALQLSLSEGISGGVEEVIYYQKEDGETYLRIKKVSITLSDQASLFVGMEFINQSNGFALSVAGGGRFSDVGIAASGSISTINNNLRFGVFVAATAKVNILGIVEASNLGGGFYYRPTMENLNMTISAVENMDDNFELQGQQPDVQNLKFAILLYAKIAIGGSGSNSAVSASAFVQVTDQFTKIDAVGEVLNQDDKFKAGLYLTILYTPDVVGVEGGVNMNIDYAPAMDGESEVDFFAKKERTQGSDVIWGITGNFQLEVLPQINMLSVEGALIVSPDGLLLELGTSSGFNVAIISAEASFELLVWYLPQHTDPMGIYGKFSVSFSIVGGLAEFGASVEGGYFNRGTYKMIYFAGEAYVKVVGVIDGRVRGWVKFQTKSPNFDYGRGGSSEMEQMIADAKEKANETKDKAEETKDELNDAKDELNDALAAAALEGYSAQQLRKAGFNIVSGNYTTTYSKSSKIGDVLEKERDLHGSVPDVIEWIEDNVMQGNKKYRGTPAGYDATRERPEIKGPEPSSVSSLEDMPQLLGTQAQAISEVQNEAPQVESRIDEAITELGALSDKMRTSLEENTLSLSNPVTNIQDATTGGGGELISAPSFRFDSVASDTNKSRLSKFDEDLLKADARYREAIKSVAANVELVDLVASGEASISWSEDTGVQMQESQGTSVNGLAYTYTNAIKEIRDYNSELIGSYWNMADWADYRYNYISQNETAIKNFARKTNDWSLSNLSEAVDAGDVAAARMYVMSDAQYTGTAASDAQDSRDIIGNTAQNVNYSTQQRYDHFRETGEDFWYYMPLYGLDELRNLSEHKADSLLQFFDNKLSTIKSKHRAFTESVDQLYIIKSEMLVTVYGMIEEYNGWRKEAFPDDAPKMDAPFTSQKQEIEEALAPPTIDFISGQAQEGDITSRYFTGMSDYRDFYGIAGLSYEASHSQGIPEMSYAILDGSINSIYLITDYYTAGVWDTYSSSGAQRWFQMKFPKENMSQTSRDLTGVVRARGTGGTTISRFVNFTIPVGRGGTEAGGVTQQGDDSSPPTKPVIEYEYESDINHIWTTDSTQLSFTFKSSDQETDVRLYKYKIGTTKGGSQLRSWTEAQGSRGQGMEQTGTSGFFNFPTFSFTSSMQTTIRGLSLQSNTDYYISVKAVNGDSLESAVKEMSKPFRYEPTPPEKPEVNISYAISQRQQAPSQPVTTQAVMDEPDWEYYKTNDDQSSDDQQEMTVAWSSNDPESGIDGFSVGTMRREDATASEVFRANDVDYVKADNLTELTLSNTSYNTYWYVQARNNASMNSGMTVVGPVEMLDISPPTTPKVKVQWAPDGFYIHVTQLADDNQTGIKGYQYAILDESGSDTLRTWPRNGKVDFEEPYYATNEPDPLVEFVPWGSFMDAGNYQVTVRAVNDQNMVSRVVTNTGVLFDDTPPERTLFKPLYDGSKGVTVSFNNIGDEESGLKSVEYQIITDLSTQEVQSILEKRNQPNSSVNYTQDGDFGIILQSGTMARYGDNQTTNIITPNLLGLETLYMRITVRNNVGIERSNVEEIEISGKSLEQYKRAEERKRAEEEKATEEKE